MWLFGRRNSERIIKDPLVQLIADKVAAMPSPFEEGDRAKNRLPPPATLRQVAATEAILGFGLPPLLRSCYLEFANGGFGPGYGLMGVKGGFTDDLGHDIGAAYISYKKEDPEDSTWRWPRQWLPVLHWGCAIYSCVDCSSARYQMCVLDPNQQSETEGWAPCFLREPCSLDEWLKDWVSGIDLWERLQSAQRNTP
jgi:SMI1 / KNR4 family (SUKH-1)